METVQMFGPVVAVVIMLVWGLITILAVLEIFFIGATLKKIDATLRELLVAVKSADKRRREEFNAMTQGGEDA